MLKQGLKKKVSHIKCYNNLKSSPTGRNSSLPVLVQSAAESYLRDSEKVVDAKLTRLSNISDTNRKSSAGRSQSPFRVLAKEREERTDFESWKDRNIRLNKVPNYKPTRSF